MGFTLALALCLAGGGDALAQSQNNQSPRAAIHEGFGRLVFDWARPVKYSADIAGNTLVVRFERPFDGNFRRVLRPLERYLGEVSVSADRKTATFSLVRPVQIKTFTTDAGSVVIDLIEDGADQAAKPQPASDAALPEIKANDHGGYFRLSFDWGRKVPYRVDAQGGTARVVFERAGRVDAGQLGAVLPSDIALTSVDAAAKRTTLAFTLPPGGRMRHFASDGKVVVDIMRDPKAQPPAGTVSLPAGNDGEPGQPTLKPLGAESNPRLPSEMLAGNDPAKAGGAKVTPSSPAVMPPAVAGASSAQVPANDPNDVFSLSVSWDKPVAAAVFSRAGYLWMVFDRHQEVDTRILKRLGGLAVTFVEQIKNRDATVLRLIVQPDYQPSLRRDGLLWVVDLAHQSSEAKLPIPITAPVQLATGTGMALAVQDAGNLVSVVDPEIGDTLLVVPVMPLGAGIYPGRETPDATLLPTYQGVAVIPHVDTVDVRPSRNGVTVGSTGNGGLRMSQPGSATAETADTQLFDIPGWARGGPEHIAEDRHAIDNDLAQTAPARRPAARMVAARYFFANGMAAEALGHLKVAGQDEPTLVDTGAYRALRGAANAMMRRWDQASFDLDNPLVKDNPEARFWSAVTKSGTRPLAGLSPELAKGLAYIKDYPKPLRWPLATLIASAAMAANDDATAQAALTMVDRMAETPTEKGQRDFLRAGYAEMAGKFDTALERYLKAQEQGNREIRAKAALAEVELRLRLKSIKPKEAEERLNRLRFSWRDEGFEFGLLRRLAELQAAGGNYPDALRSLRALANYYPANPGTPDVIKAMQELFVKLYLEGGADSLPPVSAIGLYDEFRDLTPTGPKGDEMIRKLADRLVAVDLLDRAAELLKHQVTYRLSGPDKVRVGTQLAVLDILDKRPKDALDALAASEMPAIAPELASQRRHLKASALANLDRVPEAIALLAGDASQEATLLKAEIYWRKQDWDNAAQAFQSLVAKPALGTTLDDARAKLVLNWATALVLANDEPALAALRRNFAASLERTPYRDGFRLLSSALDREVPDLASVTQKVREAEGFKTFMSDYRDRLQKGGVSAIN